MRAIVILNYTKLWTQFQSHLDIHDNSRFNTSEGCDREHTLGISVSTLRQPSTFTKQNKQTHTGWKLYIPKNNVFLVRIMSPVKPLFHILQFHNHNESQGITVHSNNKHLSRNKKGRQERLINWNLLHLSSCGSITKQVYTGNLIPKQSVILLRCEKCKCTVTTEGCHFNQERVRTNIKCIHVCLNATQTA